MFITSVTDLDNRIVRICCTRFGVTREDVFGPRRFKYITHARHTLMYLLRRCTPLSYPDIGRFLRGRDHSTIVAGVKKIEKLLRVDAGFCASVESMIDEITGTTTAPTAATAETSIGEGI